MSEFTITSKWLSKVKDLRDTVDSRLCQLRVNVGAENVTSYVGDDDEREDAVVVPGYYLAEWIAENWWPILWEPRKSEDDNGQGDYAERHCMLAAQHGFALPAITFTPTGERLSVYAGSRRSELAGVRFDKTGNALVSRSIVEDQLRSFVVETIKHLDGIDQSPLHEAWTAVDATKDDDTILFCKLIGSLGLSPYEEHPAIEKALDSASDILSRHQLMDLCSTSPVKDMIKNTFLACRAQQDLDVMPAFDLKPLNAFVKPKDNFALPAYRTGYSAARTLREKLFIAEKDVDGASKAFRKLGINSNSGSSLPASDTVYGVAQRKGDEGKISILSTSLSAQRFATARGAYLCWISSNEARLITGAVTRDQQASRAFAAEMLMPRAYVKSQAEGNKLSYARMEDISEREVVAFDTIKFQAQNAGLTFVR